MNNSSPLQSDLLTTHDVGVQLPMNTKYVSGNPISRQLIRNFMTTIIDIAKQFKPITILDVGCGEGIVSRQFQEVWGASFLHGIDIETELLVAARQIVPQLTLTAGSIYELPYPTNAFDLVACTEVMEHLDDPIAAMQEIKRVCRQYCIISVPNEPIWRIANMARGSYWSDLGNTPGHINHWSSAKIAGFVGDYFEVLAVRKPFPWTIVFATSQ